MGDAFHCKRDTLKLAWTLCREESLQKLLSCVYFGPFGKKKIGNFFKKIETGAQATKKTFMYIFWKCGRMYTDVSSLSMLDSIDWLSFK